MRAQVMVFGLVISFATFCLTATPITTEPPAKRADGTAVVTQTIPDVHGSVLSEADAYKLLYESEKESNRRLDETMQWSVGLVAAFLLAIAGSQIFFNYRLGKKEVSAIRSDNDQRITSLIANAREELSILVRDSEERSRTSRDELGLNLKERTDTLKSEMEGIKLGFRRDIDRLSLSIEEASGHVWSLRGVKSNALANFIRAARMRLESGSQVSVQYSLKDIAELLPEMTEVNSRDHEQLIDLLAQVPDELAELRERIRDLCRNKPLYEFLDEPDPITKRSWRYVRDAPGSVERNRDGG